MAKLNSYNRNEMAHKELKNTYCFALCRKVPIPNLYEWHPLELHGAQTRQLYLVALWLASGLLEVALSFNCLFFHCVSVFASLHGSEPKLCKQRELSFPS